MNKSSLVSLSAVALWLLTALSLAAPGDQAQQEAWRAEYGPAIATGRAVLRELRAFERIYGESLREVAAMRHEQLMTGLPRTGLAGEAAKRLVTTLAGTDKSHGTASQAVVLLEGTRRGIEDAIRSIERIIENPTHWSGGINDRPDTPFGSFTKPRHCLAPLRSDGNEHLHARPARSPRHFHGVA